MPETRSTWLDVGSGASWQKTLGLNLAAVLKSQGEPMGMPSGGVMKRAGVSHQAVTAAAGSRELLVLPESTKFTLGEKSNFSCPRNNQ